MEETDKLPPQIEVAVDLGSCGYTDYINLSTLARIEEDVMDENTNEYAWGGIVTNVSLSSFNSSPVRRKFRLTLEVYATDAAEAVSFVKDVTDEVTVTAIPNPSPWGTTTINC